MFRNDDDDDCDDSSFAFKANQMNKTKSIQIFAKSQKSNKLFPVKYT